MNNINISVVPTKLGIASCIGCSAHNYRTGNKGISEEGEYVRDLYDVHIGSHVVCLCSRCLGVLEQQARHMRQNRALPEVFAIVKGSDFSLQIIKGKMETVDDNTTRVVV